MIKSVHQSLCSTMISISGSVTAGTGSGCRRGLRMQVRAQDAGIAQYYHKVVAGSSCYCPGSASEPSRHLPETIAGLSRECPKFFAGPSLAFSPGPARLHSEIVPKQVPATVPGLSQDRPWSSREDPVSPAERRDHQRSRLTHGVSQHSTFGKR